MATSADARSSYDRKPTDFEAAFRIALQKLAPQTEEAEITFHEPDEEDDEAEDDEAQLAVTVSAYEYEPWIGAVARMVTEEAGFPCYPEGVWRGSVEFYHGDMD